MTGRIVKERVTALRKDWGGSKKQPVIPKEAEEPLIPVGSGGAERSTLIRDPSLRSG
jgi:hypothetical protein